MSEREFVLEVTQEDYEKKVAQGIDEEAILKPGKHIFRRTKRVAKSEDLHPSNIKVELMIKLDLDVVRYFQEQAAAPDADSLAIQINRQLRAAMERDAKQKTEDIEMRLLQNKEFISSLAEELKKIA